MLRATQPDLREGGCVPWHKLVPLSAHVCVFPELCAHSQGAHMHVCCRCRYQYVRMNGERGGQAVGSWPGDGAGVGSQPRRPRKTVAPPTIYRVRTLCPPSTRDGSNPHGNPTRLSCWLCVTVTNRFKDSVSHGVTRPPLSLGLLHANALFLRHGVSPPPAVLHLGGQGDVSRRSTFQQT